MSNFIARVLGFHNWWNGVPKYKASLRKDATPLRIGVLGAAAISPVAIFDAAGSHPGVEIVAVAARTQSKAEAQIAAQKLRNCTAYGSYAELLADDSIDAVYIPLPNGLHAEWAIKALDAGKHVLLEKPLTSNAGEARAVREAAARSGKVALEAFHWRFHPAAHKAKEIIASGEYGDVLSVHSTMCAPAGSFAADDIRFNYALAGGACMDLTYVFSTTSYYASPDMLASTYTVTEARPRTHAADVRVDEAMQATYTVAHAEKPLVTCTVDADLSKSSKFLGFIPKFWDWRAVVTIELQRARVTFDNFPAPWLMHSITVAEKDPQTGRLTGKKHKHKAYVDGAQWGKRGLPWWTTYRYQLEAFVDRVRDPNAPGPWVSLDESVKLMELIDSVYDKADLPRRGEETK